MTTRQLDPVTLAITLVWIVVLLWKGLRPIIEWIECPRAHVRRVKWYTEARWP